MPHRPPPDITPRAFFEEWLPAQLGAGLVGGARLTVRVVLDGDGGGAWDLRTGDSGLTVSPPGGATLQGVPSVIVNYVADGVSDLGGSAGRRKRPKFPSVSLLWPCRAPGV